MIKITFVNNFIGPSIGDQLITQEEGWTRYDDRDSNIIYTNMANSSFSTAYNGTLKYGKGSAEFYFFGEGFRILTKCPSNVVTISDKPEKLLELKVDDIQYDNQFFNYNNDASERAMVLQYTEILDKGYHKVTITNKSTDAWSLALDCFDIYKGNLVSKSDFDTFFNLESYIKNNLTRNDDLSKIIKSEYTKFDYTDGKLEFTPNGKYIAICVNSSKRDKILVSTQTNQQTTVDDLNKLGYLHGIKILESDTIDISARTLTGGFNANSPNEWDEYITNNSLGLLDYTEYNAWVFSGRNITPTVYNSTYFIDRVVRGEKSPSDRQTYSPNYKNYFRPAFVVNVKYEFPEFDMSLLSEGVYNYESYPLTLSNINLDSSIDENNKLINISIVNTDNNKVIKQVESINIINNSIILNINLQALDFNLNKINTVVVTMTDINNFSSSKTLKIFALDDNFAIGDDYFSTVNIDAKKSNMLVSTIPTKKYYLYSVDDGKFKPGAINNYVKIDGTKVKFKFLVQSQDELKSYGVAFLDH